MDLVAAPTSSFFHVLWHELLCKRQCADSPVTFRWIVVLEALSLPSELSGLAQYTVNSAEGVRCVHVLTVLMTYRPDMMLLRVAEQMGCV